jgi:hypothetical protein
MVVASQVAPTEAASYVWRGAPTDSHIDYRQLLRLPTLGKLTVTDVENWLGDVGLPRHRRVEIAAEVIGEGNPPDVYEGLQEHGFWREIAEGRL